MLTPRGIKSLLKPIKAVVPDKATASPRIRGLPDQEPCPEMKTDAAGTIMKSREQFRQLQRQHNGALFTTPVDLRVAHDFPTRILLVGSCFLEGFPGHFSSPCKLVQTNNLWQLGDPPEDIKNYDVQVVQLSLHSIIPFLSWAETHYADQARYEVAFAEALERLRQGLKQHMKWNEEYGIPTLVMNFFTPLQNPLGEWLPHNDLRNIVFAIEELNRVLADEVDRYSGAHYFDVNALASTLGKKHLLDSIINHDTHGALIGDWGYDEADRNRLEPIAAVSDHYDTKIAEFLDSIHSKITSFHRSAMQVDSIKLIIVDLDNTLWKGIAGEDDGVEEGAWATGFWEALLYLKKRGLLLAIASKNTHQFIEENWQNFVNARFKLSDFAIAKINWEPKPVNIGAIMKACNIAPENTLFIDDNPVERQSVLEAYPGLRTLGSHPYYFKRILLWSAETQHTHISSESSVRTQSIKVGLERETLRDQMSRDDFLKSLNVAVDINVIIDRSDADFKRAFELTNKTNQFNTTGKRWTVAETETFLSEGGRIYTVRAKDRLTDYGLIGCVYVKENVIEQLLLSCRVIGLDIELQTLEVIARDAAKRGNDRLKARFIETPKNGPCKNMFPQFGMQQDGELFIKEI